MRAPNYSVQPGPPPRPRFDLGPLVLGSTGCGCGMIMAGMAILLLILVSASAAAMPVTRPDPNRPDITIKVQDKFLAQSVAKAVPADVLRDMVVKTQPGGQIVFTGKLETAILGQQISAPFTFVMRLSAENGRIKLDVVSLQLASNELVSGLAQQFFSSIKDQVTQIIDEQVRAGLGPGAFIMDVTTDDHQLIIRARWTTP